MLKNILAPIMCTLAPKRFKERLAWISKLKSEAVLDYRRDNLSLFVKFKPQALESVRELVRQEQDCCSYLDFDVREYPDRVELVVTAPERARGSFDLILDQLTTA